VGSATPIGTITGRVSGIPWRKEPITLAELPHMVRRLASACFIVICYLSGLRPGEVLKLQRGCAGHDEQGQPVLLGDPSKGPGRTPGPRAEDAATARCWAVVALVAQAVTVLESLSESRMLFPSSWSHPGTSRGRQGRARTRARSNVDLRGFIDWVNETFAQPGGEPPIPPDPVRPVHASRFRRTLAYFIVRRPGGLIAAALQYAHVSTKVTLSYAGEADTTWLDDLTIERLEAVVDRLDEDLGLLADGEHVSGPSAQEYRNRLERRASFAGRVVNKSRNLERLLNSADPDIHHGRAMTCVHRKETALCAKAREAAGVPTDGPHEAECQLACVNLAFTDRDIASLGEDLRRWQAEARDPLSPRPRRERAAAQANRIASIIERHERTRPGVTKNQEGVA
jgi:integrase